MLSELAVDPVVVLTTSAVLLLFIVSVGRRRGYSVANTMRIAIGWIVLTTITAFSVSESSLYQSKVLVGALGAVIMTIGYERERMRVKSQSDAQA